MSFNDLRSAIIPADGSFTPRTGDALYIAKGRTYDSSREGYYVGVTRNSMEQRHREHGTPSCDRPYGFHVENYMVFELPNHWANFATCGEVSAAEDLTMYTMAHNLNGSGHRLDNRRINTKVRLSKNRSIQEVSTFLEEKVYPLINKEFVALTYHEPTPHQTGFTNYINTNEYYYTNGSRGRGSLEKDIKQIYKQNPWIFTRATYEEEQQLAKDRQAFYARLRNI